jgi:hypothetical protein
MVVFNGLVDVKSKGEHRYYLSEEQYAHLLKTFDKFEFAKMESDYQPVPHILDILPIADITLNADGKEKKVTFGGSKKYVLLMRELEESLHSRELRCPYIINRIGRSVDICQYETALEDSLLKGSH